MVCYHISSLGPHTPASYTIPPLFSLPRLKVLETRSLLDSQPNVTLHPQFTVSCFSGLIPHAQPASTIFHLKLFARAEAQEVQRSQHKKRRS